MGQTPLTLAPVHSPPPFSSSSTGSCSIAFTSALPQLSAPVPLQPHQIAILTSPSSFPPLSPVCPDFPWSYVSKERKNISIFTSRSSLSPPPVPGQMCWGAQLIPCSPWAELTRQPQNPQNICQQSPISLMLPVVLPKLGELSCK